MLVESPEGRGRYRKARAGPSATRIIRAADGTYWALKIKMRLLLESTTIN